MLTNLAMLSKRHLKSTDINIGVLPSESKIYLFLLQSIWYDFENVRHMQCARSSFHSFGHFFWSHFRLLFRVSAFEFHFFHFFFSFGWHSLMVCDMLMPVRILKTFYKWSNKSNKKNCAISFASNRENSNLVGCIELERLHKQYFVCFFFLLNDNNHNFNNLNSFEVFFFFVIPYLEEIYSNRFAEESHWEIGISFLSTEKWSAIKDIIRFCARFIVQQK